MNTWKPFVMGIAGVFTGIVLLVGVVWAADILMVDKDGAVYLRISSSGNVGIGTGADPASKLTVKGSGTTSATWKRGGPPA